MMPSTVLQQLQFLQQKISSNPKAPPVLRHNYNIPLMIYSLVAFWQSLSLPLLGLREESRQCHIDLDTLYFLFALPKVRPSFKGFLSLAKNLTLKNSIHFQFSIF